MCSILHYVLGTCFRTHGATLLSIEFGAVFEEEEEENEHWQHRLHCIILDQLVVFHVAFLRLYVHNHLKRKQLNAVK